MPTLTFGHTEYNCKALFEQQLAAFKVFFPNIVRFSLFLFILFLILSQALVFPCYH